MTLEPNFKNRVQCWTQKKACDLAYDTHRYFLRPLAHKRVHADGLIGLSLRQAKRTADIHAESIFDAPSGDFCVNPLGLLQDRMSFTHPAMRSST